jgi:uncharacterized damage-inducible protein DinB
MKLTELFLEQLGREAATTRRVLERVPEGRNDWKPHERSMPLGYLAALVATMPGWIAFMITQDQLDVASPGDARFRPQATTVRQELLQMLEDAAASARAALSSTTDEHLLTPWKFSAAGRVLSEQPRYVMIADSVFAHLAHHRGQLTVYLRLNEAAVPAIYGPSADERL